jgi:2-aminophenol/2-amino-5-chlorophenol 1,6-dioxygenase subunit beta
MGSKGQIVAGVLAPHPPHLVYAENPPQNEPRSQGGWDGLRWGYEKVRANLVAQKPDVILIHSPHWQTVVGHHVLGLPRFTGRSVDPIFPHLFRFDYDVNVDVDLSLAIAEEGKRAGMLMKVMNNPDFRIDYGTITSAYLVDPTLKIPIVNLSSNNSPYYFSDAIGQEEMKKLGEVTRLAIEKSGKRAVLLASNSLSHRHFVTEPELPEDMSAEHIFDQNQYAWDMKVLKLMSEGRTGELMKILPQFILEAAAEVKAGALTWMLSAMEYPTYPAQVHSYGSVIGTGNAVVEWSHERAGGVK